MLDGLPGMGDRIDLIKSSPVFRALNLIQMDHIRYCHMVSRPSKQALLHDFYLWLKLRVYSWYSVASFARSDDFLWFDLAPQLLAFAAFCSGLPVWLCSCLGCPLAWLLLVKHNSFIGCVVLASELDITAELAALMLLS